MNINSIVKFVIGIVQLRGATDNTRIGNNSNRLLVESRTLDGAGAQVTLGRKTQATSLPVVQNAEKTFHVFQSATAIAANKSMLSFYNAVGSTVKFKLQEIKIINTRTGAITGVVADFRLKRFSTLHTAGTDLTPQSSDSTDTLSASITAKTSATIAGEAAADMRRALWSSDEWGTGTLDQEGLDHAMQNTGAPWYKAEPNLKPITLNAGEGLHIKQITASTNGTFDILAVFTEESA